MNKRDREQLRASIAKDLVDGQGEHSPTRELLKQYAPLEGIVTPQAACHSLRSGLFEPVENTMAPRATVARDDDPAWHGATEAQHATAASHTSLAPVATVARGANNKEKLDDELKIKSSSKGTSAIASFGDATGHHKGAAAPLERHAIAGKDLALVQAAYEKATGNRWSKSDTEAYQANGLNAIPACKIISVLETLTRRTPARINSFNYFIKEIMAVPDPRNRAWRKKKLDKIVRRVRDRYLGTDFSTIDFLEDVKCACAQEDVEFDNDLYNQLVG